MNIFEKLMLAKKMSFDDGAIYLLGNRVTIIQSDFFVEYSMRANNSSDKINELYEVAKITFRDSIAKSIGKAYSFTFNDFFKWMTDIAMLAGWGIVKWQMIDKNKKIGVITIEKSAVGGNLKGKVTSPVDHVIRGFIAGGASASFNIDMDAIEEECIALNASVCKFVFKPAGTFQRSEEIDRQLSQRK